MKIIISTATIVILLLGCFGLAACGSNNGSTTTPAASPTSTSSPTAAPAQTSVSSSTGLSWGDMPVYPGAKEIQKGNWAIPPTQGDYARFEWRYYNTSDDLNKVSDFYRNQMPANGWEEMGTMSFTDVAWFMYQKNNEQQAAMAWFSNEDGETSVALWKATK